MSVRLDRLQQGLFEAFNGVAADVVWTYGQVPREQISSDLLALTLTAGPSLGFRRSRRGRVLQPATSVVVRVTGTTAGVRNVIRLNDFDYFTDTTGVDTLTTIRDRLLALAIAGEPVILPTADGADGVLLTAPTVGDIRTLQLFGELGNDAPVFPIPPDDTVLVTEGTASHLVTVQAYSKGQEPTNGAWALCDAALDVLQSDAGVELLGRFGLGLWEKGPVINLSAIAGANWETRAAFDLTIAARSVSVEPIQTIETVNYSIALADASGSTVATVTGSQAAP